MTSWLGGAPGDTALAFRGDAITYAALARAVARTRLPEGAGPVACPVGTDPLTLVTTVLASIERARPVLVGGDAADAAAIADRLPAGTELALRTSGSSDAAGEGRIVGRTNASWLASAAPLADLMGLTAADRVAVTGPLHVSMQLYAALHALRLGASVGDRLDDATAMHVTPTRLARLLDGAPLPRTAVVAGGAMSDALASRAAARGIRVLEYYGAAELSFVAAGEPGRLMPFPGVDVALRPTAGGEALWARSPYLALGVVGGGMLRRDDDGYATVGDLVARGPDDAFRVLGRGDAAITTAGATVIAEEIEARLADLPGLASVALVGEPHDLLGERIVAVVELADGAELGAIATAARARLATVELPRRWIVAPVPRTESGKVARATLREAIASGRLKAGHPSPADAGSVS